MTILPTRFWAKVEVDRETGCWDWTAAVNNRGRAIFAIDGRARLAYRLAWEHFLGAIPEGMTVDHLCASRVCVNPEHMELVTREVNSSRGRPSAPVRTDPDAPKFRLPDARREVPLIVRRRGVCRRGHDLTTPGATSTTKRGDRVCLACRRERWHDSDSARRAARRSSISGQAA